MMIVEHRRSQVDEPIEAGGPGEHPAEAGGAEIMAVLPLEAAKDGLAGGDPEAVRGQRDAEREGASGHALAAGAMAGHGDEGRLRHSKAGLAAAAAAVPGKFPFVHQARLIAPAAQRKLEKSVHRRIGWFFTEGIRTCA